MAQHSRAYPVPEQRRVLSGGRSGMNVNTVDLHAKGVTILSHSEDGHRVYTARHKASGLEGKGRSIQEAYDKLVAQQK